jgi:hypothetical protein
MSMPIQSTNIQYNTFDAKEESIQSLIPNCTVAPHFGVIQILVDEVPINMSPIFILFTSDISGSMSDKCVDGSTKMEHVIHTIRNILVLFAEKSQSGHEIWVQVVGFDDKIDDIITPVRVTNENLDTLLNQLKIMRPRNGTNIEMAMKNASNVLSKFSEEHPDFLISHILTTDGNSTCGNCNLTYLSSLVVPKYINTLIGYGYDHSAQLLNTMANNKNTQYFFIDKIENGGLVFGEIIHSILYQALTDLVIQVKEGDGFIYNYATNKWENTLTVGSLAGEANKVYHICSSNPENVTFDISYIDMTKTSHCLSPSTIPTTDLSKYLFRQRTLELLFESRNSQSKSSFHSQVNLFLQQLKQYMSHYQLLEDPFFMGLHDDIVIIINTAHTEYNDMFTIARGNSNGKGLSYNVSEIPLSHNTMDWNRFGGLRRNMANPFFPSTSLDYDEDAPTQTERLLSSTPLNRAYSTPRQLEVMRSCSQTPDDDMELTEEV